MLSTTQSLHMGRPFGKIKLILFRSDVHLGDVSRVCVSVFLYVLCIMFLLKSHLTPPRNVMCAHNVFIGLYCR